MSPEEAIGRCLALIIEVSEEYNNDIDYNEDEKNAIWDFAATLKTQIREKFLS